MVTNLSPEEQIYNFFAKNKAFFCRIEQAKNSKKSSPLIFNNLKIKGLSKSFLFNVL